MYFNSLKILTLNFFFHPHQSFKQLNNIGRLMNNSLLPQLITIEVYFKKKAVYNIRSKCNSFSKLKSCQVFLNQMKFTDHEVSHETLPFCFCTLKHRKNGNLLIFRIKYLNYFSCFLFFTLQRFPKGWKCVSLCVRLSAIGCYTIHHPQTLEHFCRNDASK